MRYPTIYITGASRGLGAALAYAYARPGRSLGLTARKPDDLRNVADACRAKGADVREAVFDIRDLSAHEAFLLRLTENGPLDLAICNAGIFSGRLKGDVLEPSQLARLQVDINLWGTIATVHAVVHVMARQRRGRIALISSLAAPHPLADAPVYSATKAGLCAYAEALRELLSPRLGVSVVLPGHIRTAQTAVHEGETPGIVSSEVAADTIVRALERGREQIIFPKHQHLLGLAGRLLPDRWRWHLNRPLRFTVAKTIDAREDSAFSPPRDNVRGDGE